jgi:hypothetical protein
MGATYYISKSSNLVRCAVKIFDCSEFPKNVRNFACTFGSIGATCVVVRDENLFRMMKICLLRMIKRACYVLYTSLHTLELPCVIGNRRCSLRNSAKVALMSSALRFCLNSAQQFPCPCSH